MGQTIKFSLLIGTLNRPEMVKICLNRLTHQTYKNFEIIIIDQSENDETQKVAKSFGNLNLRYFKVGFKGLSKARNMAIRIMNGDYF